MLRKKYMELAKRNVRLPIATDLILHEQQNPQRCRFNGRCLGQVIVEAAERFNTPLAFPLMDLRTEKEWFCSQLGVDNDDTDGYHINREVMSSIPDNIKQFARAPLTPRMEASLGALEYVSTHSKKIPVGMCIGPFSLMTKLLSDPITSAYMAGVNPEDEEAELLYQVLELGTAVISAWVEKQMASGAQAICVCEPAYNTVYLSPKQLARQPALLDTLVIDYNLRVKDVLQAKNVDLIFHDCGELNEAILRSIDKLDPAMLSLGSPVSLPEVAPFISEQTVIMGNIASKKFYSDSELSEQEVTEIGKKLLSDMEATGHPFILGTECDVLSVPGCQDTIMKKVYALSNI